MRLDWLEGPLAWGAVILVVIALALGADYALGSAASQTKAEHALSNQGFSNVHFIKRHVWLVEIQGCGKEDVAKFDFRATNPTGHTVNISVCEGWPFKGATVRTTE